MMHTCTIFKNNETREYVIMDGKFVNESQDHSQWKCEHFRFGGFGGSYENPDEFARHIDGYTEIDMDLFRDKYPEFDTAIKKAYLDTVLKQCTIKGITIINL